MSVFACAAAGLFAQTPTPVVPLLSTTGVIGAAEGQIARLNVLNPGVVPPATGAVCSAQISFVGENGNVIKTSMVSINPGNTAAIALDGDIELKLIAAERKEIRATIASSCKLIGTVEIFDKFTGRTQAVLGGFHSVAVPVAASAGN
jgi:hypothetical protein